MVNVECFYFYILYEILLVTLMVTQYLYKTSISAARLALPVVSAYILINLLGMPVGMHLPPEAWQGNFDRSENAK